MRRYVSAILLLVLSACGPVPRPQPQPAPGPDRTAEFRATCQDVYRTELEREADPGGLEGCINQARGGKTKDDLIAWIRTSPEYIALHSFHPLPSIGIAGRSFTINGVPTTLKGVTAFQLMDRWLKGENIQPFLDKYARANLLIVFTYTTPAAWGEAAWPMPTPEQVVAFVKVMNQKGKYVEMVLLTSAGNKYVEQAKAVLAALAEVRTTSASNVIVRLGNEPAQQNGANNPTYSTRPLQAAADASGFIYDSGFYADGGREWFGAPGRSYISPHTKRDDEWPRRGHDCYDQSHQPQDAAPGAQNLDVPCFLGEPEKAGNATAADYKAYGGTAIQFGAGGACHTETGKYAQLPTPTEEAVCNAFFDGLEAFPAGTNTGAYSRIDGVSLRTYKVGNTMVMIRPNRPGQAPEPGWRPIDADGLLWVRP